MPLTKQQAYNELKRRQSQKATKELARRELVKRGGYKPKPKGFGGFINNFQRDVTDFGKGLLSVGYKIARHPVQSAKKIGGMGYEIAKQTPNAFGELKKAVIHYPETQRRGIQAFSQLRSMPLDVQRRQLSNELGKINQRTDLNPNQKRVANLGFGLMGNYAEYSRPGEKIYNQPFSFALDVLPATKALGAGKLATKTGQVLSKTGPGARLAAELEEIKTGFQPMGRLRQMGYGKVADDLIGTQANMRKAQEGIIRSTINTFENKLGLSKAEKGEFFEAIDSLRRSNEVPKSANPKVQMAIDWYMKKELPSIRKIAGYENEAPIQNYLHHFFNPTKETKFGGKLSSPQRGFLKQSKDVEGYIKDPIVSIAGVKSKAALANIKDGFVQRVFEKWGKPMDAVTEFKGGKVVDKVTGEELMKYKGQYLPKNLGEELTRIDKGDLGGWQTVLQPLKAFNRNWKPLATAVRPRYHLRNILGNAYNSIYVGKMNPARAIDALFGQLNNHIATQIKEGTIAGKVYKAFYGTPVDNRYFRMATEDGVVGKGFFGADINDLAEIADNAESFAKAIDKMKNPAEIYRIPVLRQYLNLMQGIGESIEDNARLALYIDQLKKGATRSKAVEYVNKHLFDYLNGLGETDKAIKAVIPFWSWTRFNVPLQYGSLWSMPLKNVLAKNATQPYVQASERNNPEYAYLSDREKAMGAFKIGEVTKDGKVYDKYMRTQSVLPIQDISRVADVDNMGVSPLFSMLRQLRYQSMPPENPEENLNYFGRPVERYPGESKNYLGMPMRGTTAEIAGSIPLLSEINKLIGGSYAQKDKPGFNERLQTVTSPVSLSLQDREKNREYSQADYNRKIKGTYSSGYETALKGLVKKAMEGELDPIMRRNFTTLVNLLGNYGYNSGDIARLIQEAQESYVKANTPKPQVRMAPRIVPYKTRSEQMLDFQMKTSPEVNKFNQELEEYLEKNGDKLKPFYQ